MTRFLAGADVGGTFTDIAVYDTDSQTLTLNKLLTTPDDPRRAIVDGLAATGLHAGLVVHGTTLVTNALIERRGVPTGLLTTDGYRDVLEIGTELRYDTFDLQLERPAPLVERRLRRPVRERLGADGSVVLPLDEGDVRDAAAALHGAGVRSVAIAFFNSYRNPAHEERAKAILREAFPDLAVCTSAEIAPEVREYERFSTAAANAYIAPIATRYLLELERALGVPLFIMLSDGGITTARAASEQPIALVESGPAAGAMGAAFLARQAGWDDVIAFDMGGTTAKVSLIHGGQPHRTHELEAARIRRFKKGSGLPLRLPVIELIEIGAGGGSIAASDHLGLLGVGPRSAGAVPGPACYGAGGTDPTVTDADLVRGYLAADGFLGGRMKLDKDRAVAALQALGDRLGLDVTQTAAGIARVVDNNMATAARVHIAEAGTDPGRYRMVAFGGAGPVHAYALARLLNVSEVIFPRGAGVASAIGMLVAPRSVEFTRSLVAPLDRLDWGAVDAILAELEARGRAILREGGVTDAEIAVEVTADMRYAGQGFEVGVSVAPEAVTSRDAGALRAAFDAQYVKRFGRSLGGLAVEAVSWRVRVVAPPSVTEVRFDAANAAAGEALVGRRDAYFAEAGGYVSTPVYARDRLAIGTTLPGPALITEAETTAVIGPDSSVTVDAFGNLIMRLSPPQRSRIMKLTLALAAFLLATPAFAQTPSPVVAGETIATPELVAAACAEGKVTYYTAQRDADERQIVAKFQQAFPCIQVSVISAVTGRLYERLMTEAQAGKPQADLTILTDEALVQRMIDAKMVRPWTPPQAGLFAANAKQDGWWYGASGALMYFIYNNQILSGAEVPKSWAELADPKWKGKISMAPVTTGGTSWVQFDFMKEKLPAAYLPALAAQEPKVFSAYAAVGQSVARGETVLGIIDSLDDYPLRVGQGAPIAPVYPSEGVPFVNYPMMLLTNAPHPKAAELFGNWYLSKVAQTELARLRGVYSFRPDVPPAPGNPPLAGLNLWNPGHDAVMRDHDSLVNLIIQIFGRR